MFRCPVLLNKAPPRGTKTRRGFSFSPARGDHRSNFSRIHIVEGTRVLSTWRKIDEGRGESEIFKDIGGEGGEERTMSRRQVKRRKTWIVAEKLQRTGGVKRVKWLIPSLPACFVSPDPFNVT